MQVGDLVVDVDGQLGIILTRPRLSEDCKRGGEAYMDEWYYLIDIQFSRWVECVATDEVEVVSELSSR